MLCVFIAFPEDLFRYASKGVRSYSLSSTTSAYFSIDGGNTLLAQFNNIRNGADAGDWAKDSPTQVNNAFGVKGAYADLNVEKVALDVIGYNFINTPTVLPMPSVAPSISKTPIKTFSTVLPSFSITASYSASLLAHPQATQIQAVITAAITTYQSMILSMGTAKLAFDIMSGGLGNISYKCPSYKT